MSKSYLNGLIQLGRKLKKSNRDRILEEIRNNHNVTNKQLSVIIGISKTVIENNNLERIGSKKTGYWKIKD